MFGKGLRERGKTACAASHVDAATSRNRDSITFDDWVGLDLPYVRKRGARTDLKIIVQTVGVVLTAQGS